MPSRSRVPVILSAVQRRNNRFQGRRRNISSPELKLPTPPADRACVIASGRLILMATEVSMLRRLMQVTGILLVVGATAVLSAAGGAIGMAVANGSFQVDHSAVYGNGTLFDGSVVETAKSSSRLQLTGGERMRLAGESRAKVYQHRPLHTYWTRQT